MEINVTNRYRHYVLGLMFLVYTLNFLDRQLMVVLLEPIKREFMLTDTQMGILTGIAFALLYTTLSFPIARMADRANRVGIITGAVFLWSIFTVFTGFSKMYWQLFLSRVGVGIGEAGCCPATFSIISDYFPKEHRGRAISLYSMGIPLGVFLGLLLGGNIAQYYDWRTAFIITGIPGLIVSILIWTTLKSPPRGYSDHIEDDVKQLSFGDSFRTILKNRSFVHLSMAAGLHSMLGYGLGTFFPSFLMRAHGLNVGQAGIALAFLYIFGAGGGTYLGGALADRLAAKTGKQEYYLWIPAIATLLYIPTALGIVSFSNLNLVFVSILFTNFLGMMFWGPTAALTQRLAPLRERAFAIAMLFFVVNFLGLGLGPVYVGYLSNLYSGWFVAGGMSSSLADAEGLRFALISALPIGIWCAAHYFLAARTLKADLAIVESACPHLGKKLVST
jgi:MFS family permease